MKNLIILICACLILAACAEIKTDAEILVEQAGYVNVEQASPPLIDMCQAGQTETFYADTATGERVRVTVCGDVVREVP